jgi:hypothetical protein
MDVQVMQVRSIRGNLYDLTIIDESSSKMLGRPIAERRFAGEAAIPIFKSIQQRTGNKIKRIVLNNVPEFFSPKSVLGAWMIQKGIDIVPSTRYTSNENDKAKNCKKRRLAMIRTIRIRARLPKRFWAECSRHARCVNARFCIREDTNSPDEEFDQIKPKLSDLHVFGCHAYAWIPVELRKKLDCKCTLSIYLDPMGKGH